MKLYYMPGACSLASHITLEWVGEPYETVRIAHDRLKSPEYLAINPLGAVPALELLDGTVLTQNASVLAYLADRHPEAGLEGDGTPQSRAEVHRWFGMLNSDMHPAFKPFFGSTAYLGDEAVIEKTKDNARERLVFLFGLVNDALYHRDWIAGHRSIADPYLFVMTRWAHDQGIDVSDLGELARHHQTMNEDATVMKVLKDEGLA
ncbi:glutathione S-transferase N-terminal domain-containing protein [Pontibaca methylaminivorans]|uniref:Glutathione S-transferase n=1 Tax=Pontibaca methylaminivorans TaxID=515897 RepID=A0A1R3WBZ4_9RHOB|nr:glutathione S-transferase N-terminal domain-containing protein [Pontibaca methylaminivorans]SIT75645.1 glutathione S-transferase [Pontibaca methylaminivorans]